MKKKIRFRLKCISNIIKVSFFLSFVFFNLSYCKNLTKWLYVRDVCVCATIVKLLYLAKKKFHFFRFSFSTLKYCQMDCRHTKLDKVNYFLSLSLYSIFDCRILLSTTKMWISATKKKMLVILSPLDKLLFNEYHSLIFDTVAAGWKEFQKWKILFEIGILYQKKGGKIRKFFKN